MQSIFVTAGVVSMSEDCRKSTRQECTDQLVSLQPVAERAHSIVVEAIVE